MARIAVAATAPFGADVLRAARPAARDLGATDATRRTAGSWAHAGAAARQGRCRATRYARAAAGAPGAGSRPRRTDGRRLRLRAPHPGGLLSEQAVAQRPSLAAASLARAAPVERAILAGDTETGVTIHETVKELDAGPIAAQERVPDRARGRCGRGVRACRGCRRAPADRRSRRSEPSFVAAEHRRRHLRRQDRRRPTACSTSTPRPPSSCVACARSPRISAPAPSSTAARSRSGGRESARRASSSRSRCSPTAASGWMPPRGCAGSVDGAVDRSRPRRSLRRRAPGLRGRGLCRPRAADAPLPVSTIATGRSRGSSRTARCSAPARSTTRSRRSGGGPLRRLDGAGAGGAAARRVPARLPRRGAALCGRERVRRARSPGPARAGGAVRERGASSPRRRGARAASRPCRGDLGGGGASRTRIPTGSPRRGGATLARETRWR